MKSTKLTTENLFFLAVFLLGLGYRLLDLGRVPLSDFEAGLALPALSLARGAGASLSWQPGYISLTGLLFFIFGSSNFLARLIPALCGSLLVLVPLFFRRNLGRSAALILAVFLAVDPGLTAFSRTSDGTTIALVFTLMAAGLLMNGELIAGGVCAGMALLGGPVLWPGLIGAGLAGWISRPAFSAGSAGAGKTEKTNQQDSIFQRYFGGRRAQFWFAMVITAVLIATQFFVHPQGLNAIANGPVEYIRSWSGAFRAPSTQSALLFFLYEPVFLFLAFFRGIKAWFSGDEFDKFLMRWMLIAILISLVNPGQTFSSSAWVLIPMLALAARQTVDLYTGEIQITPQAVAQAVIVIVLIVFTVLTIVNLSTGMGSYEDMRLKIVAIGGSVAILGLTTYLIGSGWGWESTRAGYLAAMAVLLAVSIGSASWHAAGLSVKPESEMWRYGRTVISGDLLNTTLGDISEYNTGRRDAIDIRLAGLEGPSLNWALRDFENVSRVQEVVSDEKTSIILTSSNDIPPLGERYRGQKIEWSSQPAWEIMNPEEWPVWLFLRKAPMDTDSLIIWVKTDLFPGANASDGLAN